jgi:tetratricopeptide (TPR) repeat protein/transcriptional regulator with XRE-family HTH domain
MDTFGQWLRHNRREHNLTQAELGRKLGYAQITIRKLEAEKYPPSAYLLDNLFLIFQTSEEEQEQVRELVRLIKRSVTKISTHPMLPIISQPLVGYETELSQLYNLLSKPECRLISIVGAGGVGKTRLALEVMHHQSFKHGIYFIPLSAVISPEDISLKIGEALDIHLNEIETVEAQVLTHIKRRHLLLVLDTFEHLLPAATTLNYILNVAPEVKILVTSREILHLSQEWCMPLRGLPYPSQNSINPLSYDALQLFIQVAQRIRADFQLTDIEVPAIIEICSALGGVPLAIEMAASWVQVLSLNEIAISIQTDFDFLNTRNQDVPERHRSMRAVFEHSWRQLSLDEQTVLQNCSIFRGGFTKEAAQHIARASLKTLIKLQDHHLLQRDVTGRYIMHDLLIQFAELKLGSNRENVLEHHADFYAKFVAQREFSLKYRDTLATVTQISKEIDNIRKAWSWVCQTVNNMCIKQMWEVVGEFYDITSQFDQGEKVFREAYGAFAVTDQYSITAILRNWQAWFIYRQKHFTSALEMFNDVAIVNTLSKENLDWEHYYILSAKGFIEMATGLLQEAKQDAELALNITRKISDPFLIAQALLLRGGVEIISYDFKNAQFHLDEALQIMRDNDISWGLPEVLSELGYIAEELGNLDNAEVYFLQSLSISKKFKAIWGEVRTKIHLSRIQRVKGEYSVSRETLLNVLSTVKGSSQDWLILEAFTEIAMLLHEGNLGDKAAELFYVILHHPACHHENRIRATTYQNSLSLVSPTLLVLPEPQEIVMLLLELLPTLSF